MHPTRREMLRAGVLALAGTPWLAASSAHAAPAAKPLFSAVGIAASIDQAAVLKAAGAAFLTENVGTFLMPDQPDAAFAKSLARLAASPLPILACNGFIRPAHLRCVGADANHDAVLAWSEIVFRRLQQIGGKFIVFGSSSARALRDGWPKKQADAQFVALLKRMGPLAEMHRVTVVVEQLQTAECNYINHLCEAATLIRDAGHPHVRVLADLFHMACVGDTPADLKAAMDVVVHLEIAEQAERTVPGVHGDDFRPFFRVLREAGYAGAISIEGGSTAAQLAPAFQEIAKQAAE